MKNFFNPIDRLELIERVQRLAAENTGKWGLMTVNQAVCHMADCLRILTGEITIAEGRGKPMKFPFAKELILYVLPVPKGKGKTAPETDPQLKGTQPTTLDCDVEALLELINKVSGFDSSFNFPAHPGFGKLTYEEWGRLIFKHMDHHLRQFGV